MVGPVNPVAHMNFTLDHLPPNSADFYNTKGFIENEFKTLASQASQEEKDILNGLHEIKQAINGES